MELGTHSKRNPLCAKSKTRELARLHVELLNLNASSPIINTKDKARFCILGSELLSDDQKGSITEILENLPEGESLCHGDFHPGNIILSENKHYVIDWSAASVGDFHSDVAHTYVLLRNVPRVPSLSRPMHLMQRYIGKGIANTYLRSIAKVKIIDEDIFSKWVLIKAAERTYYGLPSEKAKLVSFVRHCMALLCSNESLNGIYRSL